jgi:hypothetical protein
MLKFKPQGVVVIFNRGNTSSMPRLKISAATHFFYDAISFVSRTKTSAAPGGLRSNSFLMWRDDGNSRNDGRGPE